MRSRGGEAGDMAPIERQQSPETDYCESVCVWPKFDLLFNTIAEDGSSVVGDCGGCRIKWCTQQDAGFEGMSRRGPRKDGRQGGVARAVQRRDARVRAVQDVR